MKLFVLIFAVFSHVPAAFGEADIYEKVGLCDGFIEYVISKHLKGENCLKKDTLEKTNTLVMLTYDKITLIYENEKRSYECSGKERVIELSWRHRVFEPFENAGSWEFPCRVDSITTVD